MDSEAFVDAHRRYAAVIHARCRRILRDGEAARDVTQEVFVRCFDRRAQLRAGGDLLAWLYRVATNLCLNQLRHQKTKQAVEAGTDAARPAWPEKPPAFEVLELLAGLDERTQAIAVYVHVDGMTHQEAAEVAQVSERTVRNGPEALRQGLVLIQKMRTVARMRRPAAEPSTTGISFRRRRQTLGVVAGGAAKEQEGRNACAGQPFGGGEQVRLLIQ